MREELEKARGFFRHHANVEISGFTVLMGGASWPMFAAAHKDLYGYEPNPEFWGDVHGLANLSTTGASQRDSQGFCQTSFVMRLLSDPEEPDTLSQLKYVAVHEYVHLIQENLTFDCGLVNPNPSWMAEGFAEYASYLYLGQISAGGAPPRICLGLAGDPPMPFGDNPAWAFERQLETLTEDAYTMGFLAVAFLVEHLGVDILGREYWSRVGQDAYYIRRATDDPNTTYVEFNWETAFEDGFGLAVADFYARFNEWIASDEGANLADKAFGNGSECLIVPR